MTTYGKIWGKTSTIFCNSNVEICRVEGIKGGVSSLHKHEHKKSRFFVESGIIKIYVHKNDYNLIDETILTAGQSTDINPMEWHKFEVMENAIFYEIYWVELDSNDIVRKDCGQKHDYKRAI